MTLLKQPWYSRYGLSHGVITYLIMLVSSFLSNYLWIIFGLAAVAYWVWRETQGPDKEESILKILFAYPDRIGDWLSPIIAFIIGLLTLPIW